MINVSSSSAHSSSAVRRSAKHDTGRELVGGRHDDDLAARLHQLVDDQACSSTAIGTGSSPAASAINRCCVQPGSSTAIRSTPRIRSDWHTTANPCTNPPQTIVCSGSGAAPAHAREVVHQHVAELWRPAGIAVSERVERRLTPAVRTDRSHSARGNEISSGTPGSKS